MYRLFLLWLGICLAVLDVPAEAASSPAAATTTVEADGIPRPRYKRYRRGSKKRKARRKARREKGNRGIFRKKAKGVITVDPPVRNQ